MTWRVRHPDPTARLMAVRGLPKSSDSCAELLKAALDPSPTVAIAAVRLLAALGGAAEAATLRSRMLTVDPAVVPAYASALRMLGDREALAVACDGLQNESPTVRTAGAIALRELRDDSAAPALRAALADDQAGVRRPALDALAALRPTAKTVEACARLLDDPDEGVRIACVRAISALAADAEALLLSTLRDTSARVRRELARRCGPLSVETVSALLCDPAPTFARKLPGRSWRIRGAISSRC